jgi:lysophospholipase L1-like esterase
VTAAPPLEEDEPSHHPLLRKTTRVLAVMLAVLLVPYATPKLKKLRVVHAPWDHTEDDAVERAPVTAAPVTRLGENALGATENNATVTNALSDHRDPLDAEELAKAAGSVAIEDERGEMAAFYKRLARTIRGEAVTRILHYGDSVIASDYVSGTMRRRMQERFGDAGHGFILTANPWEWYFHNDVDHRASDGWSMSRITGPLVKDGLYGLGGVSFHTAMTATATFGTVSRGDYGKSVSRFDVYYLEQPGGGDFQMEIKGQEPVRVSTRGDAKVSRKASVTVPDGAATMTIRTLGGGDVRTFGVVMERDGPGVTYDALGALGGRASLWQVMDADHWGEQMALRDPALVVIQYGTNESEDGGVNEPQYRKFMGDLIDTLKVAAPHASILVASPLDRAEKDDSGNLRTVKVIVRLVDLQQEIAKAHGVAFFSTFRAMGGKGSMAKWVQKGLAGSDLTHPSPAGATVLGDLFFKSLVTGYDAWASVNNDAPVRLDREPTPRRGSD